MREDLKKKRQFANKGDVPVEICGA